MIWLTFSNPAELSSTALAMTLSPALIETLVHRSACSGLREQALTPCVDRGVEVAGGRGVGDQAHRRRLGARDRIPGEEVTTRPAKPMSWGQSNAPPSPATSPTET